MEPLSEQLETGQATFQNKQNWNYTWITHIHLDQSMYIDVWDRDTGHGKSFQYEKYRGLTTGNLIYYIPEAECYFTREAFSEIKIDN